MDRYKSNSNRENAGRGGSEQRNYRRDDGGGRGDDLAQRMSSLSVGRSGGGSSSRGDRARGGSDMERTIYASYTLPHDCWVYNVVGKGFSVGKAIGKTTRTIISIPDNNKSELHISGRSQKDVDDAKLMLKRHVATLQLPDKTLRYTNYKASDMVRFTEISTNSDVFRFSKAAPHILSAVGATDSWDDSSSSNSNNNNTRSDHNSYIRKRFCSAISSLPNLEGRIRIQARFGKATYFLWDETESYFAPRTLAELLGEIEKKNIKANTSFTPGLVDFKLLAENLKLRRSKEYIELKTVIRSDNDEYAAVHISVSVKDGKLGLKRVTGNEKRRLALDLLALDSSLDIRFAVQTTPLCTSGAFYERAVKFVEHMQLIPTNSGKSVLQFKQLSDVDVTMIRHKRINSYQYDEDLSINCSMVDCYDNEAQLNSQRPRDRDDGYVKVEYQPPLSEVEVSNLRWKKMFSFNKKNGKVTQPWTGDEFFTSFDAFLETTYSIADILTKKY